MDKLEAGESVLSFRGYLQSKISDFVSEFKQSELAADLLAEFIIILSSYQEEGTHLFPPVFITEDLDELFNVTKGLDPIVIGSGDQSLETIRRAIKQCAPLAEWREWAIFVALKRKALTYGIFRADQSPLNPTPFERLRQVRDPALRIIGLSRLGGNFVEVRGGFGQFQYVDITGSQEGTSNPIEVIRKFTQIVTRDAPLEVQSRLQAFYYRVGIEMLHANHGTLVAVINQKHGIPAILDDGILLTPRVQITRAIEEFSKNESNDAFQQLFALNQLIRRMTFMDGITVLDSRGSIVGYNYFIKSSAINSKHRGSTIGGARRRAFDVLCSNLGEQLLAVVYKSQDGAVDLGSA
ncbi:MAG: hypothetical protein P4M08_03560 [Oligoflexia bacterium]|nr:hypothetical protein [Oligoflexia bacterium]